MGTEKNRECEQNSIILWEPSFGIVSDKLLSVANKKGNRATEMKME